jgi:Protein of unknown function (DUF4058)
MPLLDHFHAPVRDQFPWDSFHSTWATRIADALNDKWLSPEFIAAEHTHTGSSLEIDVATFERASGRPSVPTNGASTATMVQTTWTPATATQIMPAVFPNSFEVRVFSTSGGLTLVAAIELISPGNKDRHEERRAFAAKCASYLHQGVALIVMDIVTSRKANLHNETMRLMDSAEEFLLPADVDLYAVAYRPVLREERAEIDLWKAPCAVGQPLPLLPLRLTGDLFVPVDFEAAYQEACRRRRLI